MKITVLIPSWNTALYITRALTSITNAGHENVEVLIMDNLSTDGTAEVVKQFGDTRVRLIVKKDGGMYEALNRGIAAATGDVICWIGADDQHAPAALQKVAKAFEDEKAQWVVGDGIFLYEGETAIEKYHRIPDRLSFACLVFGNPLISPSVFFKKSFFTEVGGFDEKYKYAADYGLWLKFAHVAEPTVLHEPLSLFSYNGSNISSKSKIKLYKETLDILRRTTASEVRLQRLCNIARINLYIAYNWLKQLGK